MSSLINRIQRAMLGSAGSEKVRALLAELAIPAGGSGGSMREVRRGFLRPISDEAILRDALANLGLSGAGGGGAQSLSRIRTAILHNLHDSKTTLCDGLNDLLEPGDFGGGGGGGAPDWVPANAVIHIDLLNNRAWNDGEVGIDTLLGSDPNTENAWAVTSYDPSKLTEDGLTGDGSAMNIAIIGGALDKLLAGSTFRVQLKPGVTSSLIPLAIVSADGNSGVEYDANKTDHTFSCSSWSGSYARTINDVVNGSTDDSSIINAWAVTLTSVRSDVAVNGSSGVSDALTTDDYPTSGDGALVAAVFQLFDGQSLQSITLYDPLPDTTGLSELSEAA